MHVSVGSLYKHETSNTIYKRAAEFMLLSNVCPAYVFILSALSCCNNFPLISRSSPSYGVDELVDQPARHLGFSNDSLLVVLTYGATQFVIVHSWPVLPDAPQPCHMSWVFYFENPCGQRKDVLVGLDPELDESVCSQRSLVLWLNANSYSC